MLKKVLVLLVFVTALTSCQKQEVLERDENSKFNFTGEELFKSIMFGAGEFSQSVPSLTEMSKNYNSLLDEQKAKIDADLDKVVASIKEEDPTFFSVFKDRITSGNQHQIKKAMEASSYEIADRLEILIPGFNKLRPVIEEDIKNGSLVTDNKVDPKKVEMKSAQYQELLKKNFVSSGRGTACSWGFACVVYFAGAIYHTGAVAANLAVAFNVYVWAAFWGPSPFRTDASEQPVMGIPTLELEMMINEIALAR